MSEFGVIFDIDGVLVDSYQAHCASWQKLAAEQNWSLTEAEFASTFGRTSREIIRERWAPEMSEEDVRALDDRKEASYREIIAVDFPAMPGASQLLKQLHRENLAVAVGSSGPALNVAAVMDRLDPDGQIAVRVSGNDVTRGKPDPQVFQIAAERLGLPAASCIVIEDAPAGIEAAHAAGMRCIGLVSTGRGADQLTAADLVVDQLSRITPAIVVALIQA